jgi:translocation and assembly module TamB
MSDETATPEVPPKVQERRWRRRIAWLIGGLFALMLVLVIAGASGLWWSVRTDSGSAWVLSQLPGLKLEGGKGTLWGDYEADRIEFEIPGGGKVVLLKAGWRGLRIQRAPWTDYQTKVVMQELHAQRVDLVLPPSPEKKEPAKPPQRLKLPVELDVASLHAGEFHMAALGDKPLRDIQAKLHLGDGRGALHRIDQLSVAWDRLKAAGSARIATESPFAMEVKLDLAQDAVTNADGKTTVPAWKANASLTGPLAGPTLQASVRAAPVAQRPEQSLDLTAALKPFEAWPLGDLNARTKALDLSALASGLPVTSLSGEAQAKVTGLDQPASIVADLSNAEAGRWNEARLPVRSIKVEVSGRPKDVGTIDIRRLNAELGTKQQPGGRIEGKGQWTPKRWIVEAKLDGLQPSQLDARAASMVLSGPVNAVGTGFDGPIDQAKVDLKAQLAGQLPGKGPTRQATLAVDGSWTLRRIDIRAAKAGMGGATAEFAGVASQSTDRAPWQIKAQGALKDFDPAPWWPGIDDSPLRKGPNRLNATLNVDLSVPTQPTPTLIDRLSALRGKANANIGNSVLAGVPLAGSIGLRNTEGGTAAATVKLEAGANRIDVDGRIVASRNGAGDQWDVNIAAPALAQLAPLWKMGAAPAGEAALSGTLNGKAQVKGRWPLVTTQGQLDAKDLHVGRTQVKTAQARWQVDSKSDSSADAVVDVTASVEQVSFSQALFKGTPPIDTAQLQLKGTMRSHHIELHGDTHALPPAWTEALQSRRTNAPAPSASSPSKVDRNRTLANFVAQGGMFEAPAAKGASAKGHWAGWRGSVQLLEVRSADTDLRPLLRTRDVTGEVQFAGGPMRVLVQPGRATLAGASLRWQRIAWQAGVDGRPAQIDAQAELDPLPLAPFLQRAQPDFGWGGDLTVIGHLNLKSAPVFTADIVLERQAGDLTVTDESGKTQLLGLTDMRLGLDVHDGVWSFTQGLAGKTLGVAAGAFIARTPPQATWPSPDAPVQGVLEVQVANLGTWGPWVPAGWRLNGALRISAGIGGKFGAPEYTGEMRGNGLGVRNFLEGVNVSDGEVAIALQGPTARIDKFTAKAGSGTVALEGNASLGAEPKAVLKLKADKFQLLGRVDRRIVTSGEAQLELDKRNLVLNGKFGIDEGLFDFTRSDAPSLSADVQVVRKQEDEAPPSTANPAPEHELKLSIDVGLGEQLRLRGRGIDTGLRGDLHISSPNNRLAITGTVRAVDGTYAAYGQKLTIDRGLITFIGVPGNPRLDIEATRPNTDVRVGVQVSGTALNPRIRLFSEPEMSEIDKLSWLVLGRASEGLGRTDTALLQRAALALLAGEGGGVSDQFTKAIGLDEVSLRQTEGEVRETVVTLGKQLSRRWYVGYERSLNATTGTWQLIYRIAQRFTLRAQTGADSSLDLIWTWRWQ